MKFCQIAFILRIIKTIICEAIIRETRLTIHISARESHHSGYILVDEVVSNDLADLRVCDDERL
jgi:hypothetical protein